MPTVRVAVFSFNNYEGRKRPSKINSGETMSIRTLIDSTKERSRNGQVYLVYKPRQSLYYIASTETRVKMRDGTWLKQVRYISCADCSMEFVRAYHRFDIEKWAVLTIDEASLFLKTGQLPND